MNYNIDMHPNSLKALSQIHLNNRINIKGQKFGRLLAIKIVGNKDGRILWIFKCDCGKEIIKNTHDIKSGNVKSCGCLRIENTKKMWTTHGMTKTKFYGVWAGMLVRCYKENSKSYHNYGGRGIKCEWKNFEEFKNDMYSSYQDGLFIERINNNGNYCKKNCRWATKKEQARNTRSNHFLTFNNKTQSLAAWVEELGIGHTTIIARLKKGWTVNQALSIKPKKGSNQFTYEI